MLNAKRTAREKDILIEMNAQTNKRRILTVKKS